MNPDPDHPADDGRYLTVEEARARLAAIRDRLNHPDQPATEDDEEPAE